MGPRVEAVPVVLALSLRCVSRPQCSLVYKKRVKVYENLPLLRPPDTTLAFATTDARASKAKMVEYRIFRDRY